MAQGTLVVDVRTTQRRPVANAGVMVTSEENGAVYELRTDAAGRTGRFVLPTPELALSFDPATAAQAFSRYTVEVTAPGFAPAYIMGVQIFPGIDSVLPVLLAEASAAPVFAAQVFAQPETQPGTQPGTVIEIPAPAVLETGPRNPLGPSDLSPREESASSPLQPYLSPDIPVFAPLEDSIAVMQQQTRVLPAVYIPEAITVHLGAPGSNARNVTVSFADYIKNVASSEIFPTWPEAALRANIHAQVGFALNRVFTEWYRARGYNFQITNSTAYDQAFVEGRNIYSNISRLVDDIFNIYPRREGRLEPLFTSYCNGSTTTCSGLSQWGTVTLADRGYTPLEMLQYYFGDDVELVSTNDIRGIEASYPGYLLRRGMRNDSVRTLQRQLIRIRQDYPAIPAISSATGFFGSETEAAVLAFQRIFNLTPDGIVGPATWYAIARVYVGVTGLAEMDSEGLPLPGAVVPYPGYLLRQGARGDAVRTLQRYLNDLSTVYGTLLPLNADGAFGPMTRNAVLAFQRMFELTPDGIVGPATWNMLMRVWNNSF
ncbi:MAG TPA: peptidoglycan-binding protein [Feifaniaceae bacterium]|nr:peptidoglycan-binding protein [Feifaniaceae bacterium]